MNTTVPKTEHYAQRALFLIMKSGEWFSVRQLTDLCRISDPRSIIRTLINKGYHIEKRIELNSKRVHYKLYKLISEE